MAKSDAYMAAYIANKRGTLNVISDIRVTGESKDVLYSPEVSYNLFSVSKIQSIGTTILFDQKGVQILKNDKVVIRGKSTNNLVTIDFEIKHEKVSSVQMYNTIKDNFELWHERLEYIGESKFLELRNKGMISDVELVNQIIPTK